MADALIGHSGFVGSSLLQQTRFDALYRSQNIDDIAGQRFDTVVCAGASAQKWLANQDPPTDRRNIDRLLRPLLTMRCTLFILISTVDVFRQPRQVYEDSAVEVPGLHAYGLHRYYLEQFVQSQFSQHLIIRLPGLVGPGLRKNVIYDLQHQNNLQSIDSRGVFQFYPMRHLWRDIEIARQARLPLLHLNAAPISVAELAEQGFGRPFDHTLPFPPLQYDLRTRHARLFGGDGDYVHDLPATVQAVRDYARSTPQTRTTG